MKIKNNRVFVHVLSAKELIKRKNSGLEEHIRFYVQSTNDLTSEGSDLKGMELPAF